MGWGEPQAPRSTADAVKPSDATMPKPISVAAAEHLMSVEAERDRYRTAITEALAHLDVHPLTRTDEPMCATCHARRVLADALEGGA